MSKWIARRYVDGYNWKGNKSNSYREFEFDSKQSAEEWARLQKKGRNKSKKIEIFKKEFRK